MAVRTEVAAAMTAGHTEARMADRMAIAAAIQHRRRIATAAQGVITGAQAAGPTAARAVVTVRVEEDIAKRS